MIKRKNNRLNRVSLNFKHIKNKLSFISSAFFNSRQTIEL